MPIYNTYGADVGAFFGHGNDGDLLVTGTTTLASNDKNYTNITIESGGILQPVGLRIFCSGRLHIKSGGILRRNGNDASGATPGAAVAASNLPGSWIGGAGGGAGAGGAAGTGFGAWPYSGNNGIAGGAGAAGAGGAGTSNPSGGAWSGIITHQTGMYVTTALATMYAGPSGGGGGGGGGASSGGGGGSGGGMILICAKEIIIEGSLQSNGGNGGDAPGANGGGGSGGNGGLIILLSSYLVGTATAVGGNPGAKNGTGVAGSSGSLGQIIYGAIR